MPQLLTLYFQLVSREECVHLALMPENLHGNMSVKKNVYISVPMEYMRTLSEFYDLDHGLIIRDLNPSLNEGNVQKYFKTWGTITACKITEIQSSDSRLNNTMAYVRFSTEDEANNADRAGPHCIEDTEVNVERVVSLKMTDSGDELATVPAIAS